MGETSGDEQVAQTASTADNVDGQILAAINASFNGLPVTEEIRASILMPAAEKLAIRLVPLEALERLRDSEADTSLIDAGMWAVVGALLGVVCGIPLGGQQPSLATAIVICALAIVGLVALTLRMRFGRRSKRIRAQFYETEEIQ